MYLVQAFATLRSIPLFLYCTSHLFTHPRDTITSLAEGTIPGPDWLLRDIHGLGTL